MTLENQLVLINESHIHTTSTKAFTFFAIPTNIPENLTSPIDYTQGTLYQRIQVISKPSNNLIQYQSCIFQDEPISSKHACTNNSALTFSNTGVYTSSQLMTSLYQYDVINWSRKLLSSMLVIKDKNGNPIDDRYGFEDVWEGSPNLNLYYPMQVWYQAIIVPLNGGEPIWASSPLYMCYENICIKSSTGIYTTTDCDGVCPSSAIGWANIKSTPSGASIKIKFADLSDEAMNWGSYGLTPRDGSDSNTHKLIQLSSGLYNLKIILSEYKTIFEDIEIKTNETTYIDKILETINCPTPQYNYTITQE